ncbi:acyl carrier protein [Candidatus Pacearchaeota archaeon]|nr:acyl carrier protein [Candidatus Pacearchaeota archaeon]
MSTEEKVKEVVVNQLGVDEAEVLPEAKFMEDLLADSLDMVELTMALEEEIELEISDEAAAKIITFQDAVNIVKELKGE